ncbi:hypothetical protein TNCT_595411 [Trichonephila clavata]|uniref:Uncharacterized protein n=1 Tax=Trichonephila clavata TaxID=2740835 RepID=A0A8X6HCE9_TRICU|nr:hypothetical protein TNCT_595411 [Trichonephila clavata]
MWFQDDGAPQVFGDRWAGCTGPVPWPPSNLSSIEFSFWNALKSAVYATPVDYEKYLVVGIVYAATDIQQNPGVFERVRQSIV